MTKQNIDERLKNNPWLRERIEAIIDIADGDDTGTETADDAEERAIIELRKLGNEVMNSWAQKTSISAVSQYQSAQPSARLLKKNSFTGIPLLDEPHSLKSSSRRMVEQ